VTAHLIAGWSIPKLRLKKLQAMMTKRRYQTKQRTAISLLPLFSSFSGFDKKTFGLTKDKGDIREFCPRWHLGIIKGHFELK